MNFKGNLKPVLNNVYQRNSITSLFYKTKSDFPVVFKAICEHFYSWRQRNLIFHFESRVKQVILKQAKYFFRDLLIMRNDSEHISFCNFK